MRRRARIPLLAALILAYGSSTVPRAVVTAAVFAGVVASPAGSAMAADVPVVARRDHDKAFGALSRGEVKPLDEILASVDGGADMLVELGLDRADGRWVYEVTWLTADGRYRIVTLDAATAKILNEELK